jgi:hypothetical protein
MDKEFKNVHIENDKFSAPFLLAASFRSLVKFLGSHTDNGVLYWHFFPEDKCRFLLEQFRSKTEPPIPAKDLFEAIETFWKQINEVRNERNRHGGSETK